MKVKPSLKFLLTCSCGNKYKLNSDAVNVICSKCGTEYEIQDKIKKPSN